MKRFCLRFPLSLALLAAIALPVQAQPVPAQEAASHTASHLLDLLDRGEFAAAHTLFDPVMRQAVPLPVLEQVWKSMPAAGSRGPMRLVEENGVHSASIALQRGTQQFEALVSIAADGQVSGLLIRPASTAAPAPAVPNEAPFVERETEVGSGATALPATLALPKGDGPFPAVVLVHGSGAHDRDERIGPNRPFLDIARGLAAQGIAVLRYDKRSHARPQDLAAQPDIDAETTDDALLAVARLRQTPGIDAERIFVLGHSQGGMMAPRIGQRDPRIAGLILLAAPARNLLDILLEQNVRLLSLQGSLDSPAGQAHMAKLRADIAAVRHGDSDTRLLGQPARYWQSVDAVDPLAEARQSRQPLLILHGGQDIQVVDADWQAWQAAFARNPRVRLRHYPELNHLAMPSPASAGLAAYQIPAQVDAGLIADIADWIKGLTP